LVLFVGAFSSTSKAKKKKKKEPSVNYIMCSVMRVISCQLQLAIAAACLEMIILPVHITGVYVKMLITILVWASLVILKKAVLIFFLWKLCQYCLGVIKAKSFKGMLKRNFIKIVEENSTVCT